MRLLFISNLYPPVVVGGYELNCADIAARVRARGHSVQVLTTGAPANMPLGDELDVNRCLHFRQSWTTPGVRLTPRFVAHDLRIQWHNVQSLRSVVVAARPTAIVVWNAAHLGERLLLAAEQSAPTVYFLCDNWLAWELWAGHRSRRERLRRRLFTLMFRAAGLRRGVVRAERLIFNSRAMQDEYTNLGCDVRRGTVVHLGIDPALFPCAPPHLLRRAPSEPYRVLYSGQLTPHKGTGTLVAALAHLRAQPGLATTTLTLLGRARPAEYADTLRAQIAGLGLTDAVTFLAPRPRADLAAVYAEHDVLAFPSEWVEPFALTPLEGMATGLPVVTSLRGGTAEIVRDGENARAFAAGDPLDLAEKLAWVLTHPQESAALGQTAAAEVRARFTLDHEAAAVEAYLLGAVGRPGHS